MIRGGGEEGWDSGKGHMIHERDAITFVVLILSFFFFFFLVNNCIRNVIDREC